MEFYDSFLKITFGPGASPIVLVDYGTPLWGAISLNGSQIVQVQGFVRAAGVKAFPRGNESNTLTIEKAGIHESLEDAFAGYMSHCIGLPRTKADVLIELEDGRKWTIKDAAVQSWDGGTSDNIRINREGLVIIGGRIISS